MEVSISSPSSGMNCHEQMSQFSLLGWTFSAAGLFCSYNDGDVTTKRKQKQLVGGRAMWRTCFWLSWRIQMHMSLCAAQLLFFFSASSSSFLLFRPSPGLHAVLTLNRFGSLSLSRWPWNRKLPSCYLSWWKRLSPARTADRGRLNALTHKIKKKERNSESK